MQVLGPVFVHSNEIIKFFEHMVMVAVVCPRWQLNGWNKQRIHFWESIPTKYVTPRFAELGGLAKYWLNICRIHSYVFCNIKHMENAMNLRICINFTYKLPTCQNTHMAKAWPHTTNPSMIPTGSSCNAIPQVILDTKRRFDLTNLKTLNIKLSRCCEMDY